MSRRASNRSVSNVIEAHQTLEGEGFLVHRPFPQHGLSDFDPFLLLDEMGPMKVKPGEAKGAPDHPHRGFETVTYMLSGAFEHRDSAGNAGQIAPGAVQWMTAGGGVVHSEMPAREFNRTGGILHGLQLWVNLPARDKMMAPRYQEIPAANIPVGASSDGNVTVRVIAGEALGARAAIDTRVPIDYLHFNIAPGAKFSQSVAPEHNVFAYVLGGEAVIGARTAPAHHMILFARDGDEVLLEASAGAPLDVLLLAGAPLGEPVARWGPFVMNTQAEIRQAMEDYRSGRMGSISR